MKILAIGDITSPGGVRHLCERLWDIRKKYSIDLCIANGENASFISGISKESAEALFLAGVDAITGGNHTMQNFSALAFLDECRSICRPINYGEAAPGRGFALVDTGALCALVISAMGVAHIEPVLNSPYPYIDELLSEMRGKYDLAILDIHAEASGEKLAIAHNYDGKISVVFGTHTHVPTADCTVLPNGTGYVTDLGMCGEGGGIIGMEPASVIYKMKTRLPGKFKVASGAPFADGVIFTLDKNYKTVAIERIKF